MTDRTMTTTPPSPLDGFLEPFLRQIRDLPDGYAPASHGRVIAASFDWPPAFADALFVSARGRGLLEPYRARGARNRARWQISTRGRLWLGDE